MLPAEESDSHMSWPPDLISVEMVLGEFDQRVKEK